MPLRVDLSIRKVCDKCMEYLVHREAHNLHVIVVCGDWYRSWHVFPGGFGLHR